MTPLSQMSARSRSIALAGVVAVVLVLTAIAIMASRNHRAQQSSVKRTQSTRAMQGMSGMSVTEAGSVRLTTEQFRQFGVTFGTAEIRPLTTETRTTGVVTFDETRIAQVAPKFGDSSSIYTSTIQASR